MPDAMFNESLREARLLVPTLAFFTTPTSEKSSMLTSAISNEKISGLSFGDGSVVIVNETFPFLSCGIANSKEPVSASRTSSFLGSFPGTMSTITFTGLLSLSLSIQGRTA